MSNDIVTRLRLRPTILRKNRFGNIETDRAATALFDDCHAIMREAAAEIERLRDKLVRNADELEKQYRWHHLATEAFAAEKDATAQELRKVETECSMLRVECGLLERNAETTYENHKRIVAELTAERDEARRMVCGLDADIMEDQIEYAKHRGWDCFKEVQHD